MNNTCGPCMMMINLYEEGTSALFCFVFFSPCVFCRVTINFVPETKQKKRLIFIKRHVVYHKINIIIKKHSYSQTLPLQNLKSPHRIKNKQIQPVKKYFL